MKSVAVLTGATGGLGRAFVQELLREELDEIWAVARDPRKLEALCVAFGEKMVPIRCDLCVPSEVEGFVALLKAKAPDIRFLINNAGLARMGSIETFSVDEISKTVEVNCKLPTLICQYALPYMSRGARILNIASAAAFQPNPYIALYSTTKAYLRSYSRSLQYELKEKGIAAASDSRAWFPRKRWRAKL